MPHAEMRPVITLAAARRLVDAAIAHAGSVGHGIAVAVVDPSGEIVVAARMDGVAPAINGFAADKAYTAAMMRKATNDMAEGMLASRQQELGTMSRPRLCAWPGGQPLYEGGALIGGIGVSGAPGEVDIACGDAAIALMGLSATAG